MAVNQNEWWSDKKKIEVVTSWLILGNIVLVAGVTGVPEGTLRRWKAQPWWKDLELQIQTETDQELDAKLGKRIEKALELVNDRLENGDFLYDPKTGQFVRKPVSLKDGWKVASEMVDKRFILRKQPKEATSQEAIGDILKNLAKEFAEMAKKKVTKSLSDSEAPLPGRDMQTGTNSENIDAQESSQPELQIGVRELPGEALSDSEPLKAESSTT